MFINLYSLNFFSICFTVETTDDEENLVLRSEEEEAPGPETEPEIDSDLSLLARNISESLERECIYIFLVIVISYHVLTLNL